jgi:Zn-dependent protease
MDMGLIYQLSIWAVPVLIAITFHEAAHGYVAWKLGDATAYERGRVTFNPFRHVDPFGTILLPAMLLLLRAPFLFGWAKPVPINMRRLRNPGRDMVWVALAGPGVNILLAALSALIYQWFPLNGAAGGWLADVLRASMLINVILAVFNLLPLPPLDGGRVAVGILPFPIARQVAKLERFGLPILIVLLLVVPIVGQYAGLNLDVFALLVLDPARWMLGALLWLTAPF